MKPGDILTTAMWLAGTETDAMMARFVREEMIVALEEEAREAGVTLNTQAHVKILQPGDDHVPEVPEHIHGPNVCLLVVEALVNGYVSSSLFAADLEPDDLKRLRKITRAAYEKRYPGRPRLTDEQCLTLINDQGPRAAEDTLKHGTVH